MARNRAQILITAVDETRRAFRSIEGNLSQLRDQAGRVGDTLRTIGGAIGVGLGLRELAEAADQYKGLQARLQLAVTSQEAFNRAESELFDIAQRNRAPLAETVTLYAKLAPSIRSLGREQQDAFAVTEAINQSVALSGASAEAASGALLQFGQALAAGQLRGDEFNSVIEQTPRLAQAIADGLGVPLGALRSLAHEGKLTADVVLNSLLKQKDRLAQEYQALPDTVSGALTRLRNAFLRAFGERDANTGFTSALAQGIQFLAQNINVLINLVGTVLVAAFGRMIASLAASVTASRAEAAARLNNLRLIEAESVARLRSAQATLAQAAAQGRATAALQLNVTRAAQKALTARQAVTQAAASTTLLARAGGVLRGALALLGGPIGIIVTGLTLLGAAAFSARDKVVKFGGTTASIGQIASAAWGLVTEKIGQVINALSELVGVNAGTWAKLVQVVTDGVTAMGRRLRAMVNTFIGGFNAIGQAVGITAGFLVQRFKQAFSDVAVLARALGKDVAAAFTGDFSMSNLKAALRSGVNEMRGYGEALGAAVQDALGRDYVGETAKAVAARIQAQQENPRLFARPQATGRGTEDNQARLQLAQTQADAELRILKDNLQRASQALDRALEGRLVSIRDYYIAKTTIEQREVDAEIQRARTALETQRRIAASDDKRAQLKAKQQIAKLEADLIVLNNRRANIEVANARKAAQAERELADALAEARVELARLTGTENEAQRGEAIARSYRDLRARLLAEGDTQGVSLVDQLIDVKAAQANLNALETQWRLTTARMRNAQAAIQIQQQAGLLTEAQARRQIIALQQQSAAEMERLLPTLQQAAQAIGPEAVVRVQAWRNELERTKLVVDEMAPLWNRIGESFGNALNGMIAKGQTWRSALATLFQQVSDAFLQHIVIQPFQQWIAMQARMLTIKLGFVQQEQAVEAAASASTVAQKSAETTAVVSMDAAKAGAGAAASQASIPYVGPVLAVAAMVAMVAAVMGLLSNTKLFASGGLVTGPGTSTSDSIPARLSAGEFVMNAATVKRVGVDFLQSLNGLSQGPRISGHTLAFSTGGLVPDTPAAQSPGQGQSVRIVNVVDPTMAGDYLNSSAGERTILNVLQRNAGAVKQVLA
ncbi:MAG: tape measure protein [Candidatus Thiodiazotropha endolucinida]